MAVEETERQSQNTKIEGEVNITIGFLSPEPGMLMSFLHNN
jgi:hypothetical protein